MVGSLFFWYTDEMDIEIKYDPYEEAVNTGLIMSSEHNVLPESEWLRHIKRETGRKDLFVYYHKFTEQFVLAHWIYPPWEVDKPVCLELETMPIPPDRGGWIPTEVIKLRCRAVDKEEQMIDRRLKSQAEKRDEERKKQEGYERKYQMVDYLKKKGNEVEAVSLQNSKVHYSEGDSELTEDLNNFAKGKIITHG
jgi:hypothetical protein